MNLPTPTPVKISILNPILNEPIPTPIEMLFATLLNLIQKKKKKKPIPGTRPQAHNLRIIH